MRRSGGWWNAGKEISLTSLPWQGFSPRPINVSYCATKAWINTFREGLYLELKAIHSPVRIQALCPGFTYSEFHDSAGMDRSVIPRSLWMSAEDVVDDFSARPGAQPAYRHTGLALQTLYRNLPLYPPLTEAHARNQIRALQKQSSVVSRQSAVEKSWWVSRHPGRTLLFDPDLLVDR